MQSREIKYLFPVVAYLVGQLTTDIRRLTGYEIFGTTTWRSERIQDVRYAAGRTMPGRKITKARGGESWHNMVIAGHYPASLAWDFAFRKQDVGKWEPIPTTYWSDAPLELYLLVARRAIALGFTQAGAFWKKPDGPHLAYTPGYKFDPDGPVRSVQMAEYNAGLYDWERFNAAT